MYFVAFAAVTVGLIIYSGYVFLNFFVEISTMTWIGS